MELNTLIGKTLNAVLVYPSGPPHPAWKDETTPDIVSFSSFLELSTGELIEVSPCEVDLENEKYPSLGLKVSKSENDSTRLTYQDGKSVEAIPIAELIALLPQKIVRVENSDPLMEGAISQYKFHLSNNHSVSVRHTMPPMTIGVAIDE